MAKTLEDILKNYSFMQKSKNAFRKRRVWVDDLPEDMTTEGSKGYHKLISLLYDISELTGRLIEVNKIVDDLDFLTTENY